MKRRGGVESRRLDAPEGGGEERSRSPVAYCVIWPLPARL